VEQNSKCKSFIAQQKDPKNQAFLRKLEDMDGGESEDDEEEESVDDALIADL